MTDIALQIRQIEADLSVVLDDGIATSQIQLDGSQSSIDILSDVLHWARGRIQLNGLIRDNIVPQISTLTSKVGTLDERLDRLGLPHSDIEAIDKQGILTDLTSAAQLLSLNDCNIYSYISALSDLQSKLMDTRDLIESHESYEAGLLKQFSDEIAPILSVLERFSAEVEKSDRSNSEMLRALNAEKDFYLKAKQDEYRHIIEEAEIGLEQNGYSPKLSHEHLCELKTTLDEVHDQIQPYNDRLKGYEQLPPDLNLAQMAVQRAKQELHDLQAEWQRRLSGIESVFNI